MLGIRSFVSLCLVCAGILIPNSAQDSIVDIYISDSAPDFGDARPAFVLGTSRGPNVIGRIGRAKYSEKIFSGPYGECDVIGQVRAGDKVVMRASAFPGWSRVLLVGGGHGYTKSFAFEVGDYEVTGKRSFASALERKADDPFQIDLAFGVPPSSSRPLPTLPRSSTGDIYLGSKTGHWISEVSSSGAIVELEDGSIWEISALDQIDTSLWLLTDDIVILDSANPLYPYKLLNKDQGETAEAKLLKR